MSSTPPPTCQLCFQAQSAWRCQECDMYLCEQGGCDRQMHSANALRMHRRSRCDGADATAATAATAAATDSTAAVAAVAPVPAAAAATSAVSLQSSPAVDCEMCDAAAASVRCAECRMPLCAECNTELHAPASKAGHTRTALDAPVAAASSAIAAPAASSSLALPASTAAASTPVASVPASPLPPPDNCVVCDEVAATLTCYECALDLCEPCSAALHKPAKMVAHAITPIGGKPQAKPVTAPVAAAAKPPPVVAPLPSAAAAPAAASVAVPADVSDECEVCEDAASALYCPECAYALCGDCDRDLHKPMKMQSHKRGRIGDKPAEIALGGAPAVTATALIPPQNALAAISRSSSFPVATAAPVAVVAATSAVAAAAAFMCEMCDEFPAELNCEPCGMALCVAGGCDRDAHKPAKSAGHVRTKIGAPAPTRSPSPPAVAAPLAAAAVAAIATPVPSAAAPLCEMCESEPGFVSCAECAMDSVCKDCDSSLHKPAKLAGHKRAPLGSKPSMANAPAPLAVAKALVPPPRPITPVPAPVVAAVVPAPAASPAAAASAGALCEVCDENAAEVICAECSMDLCSDCNRDLHKPAKMQGHSRQKIGASAAALAPTVARPTSAQPVAAPVSVPTVASKPSVPSAAAASAESVSCEMCDSHAAEVHCPDCDMDVCSNCDRDLHRSGKSATHKRNKLKEDAPAAAAAAAAAVVAPTVPPSASPSPPPAVAAAATKVECDICGNDCAMVRCEACKLNLCFVDGCDKEIHKVAAKANHVRTSIAGTTEAAAATTAAPAVVAAPVAAAPVAAPAAAAAPLVDAPVASPQAKDPVVVAAATDPVKPAAVVAAAVDPKKKPSPVASVASSPVVPARKPSIPRQPSSKPERKLSSTERTAPGSPKSPQGTSKRASNNAPALALPVAGASAVAGPLSPNSSTLVSSPLPTDPQELAVLVEQLRSRLVQVETEGVSGSGGAAPAGTEKPARRKKEKKPAAAAAPVPWHQQDQEHVLAASTARAARIKARTLAAQGGATFDAVFDAPPVLSPSQQRLAHLESLISHQLSGLREDLQGVKATAAELEEAEAEVALTARRPASSSAAEAAEDDQEREERRRRRAEKKERKESRRRRREREQALRDLNDESSQQQPKGMEEENHAFLDERQRRKQEDELLERELGLDRAASSDDRDRDHSRRRRSSPSPPARPAAAPRNGLAHFEDADEPSLVAELLGDLGVDGGPSAATRRHVGKRAARAEEEAARMEQQQQPMRSKKSSSSGAGRAARIRERLLAASKLSDDATHATLQSMGDGLEWSGRHRSSRDFSSSAADPPYGGLSFSSLVDPSAHALSAGEMVARYRREARLELERRRERDMEAVWAEAHAVATAAATASVQGQPIAPLHDFAPLSHFPRPPSAVPLRVQSLFAPQPPLLDGGEGSSAGSSPRAASPSVGMRASPAIYSFMPRGSQPHAHAHDADQLSASMPAAAYASAHSSFPPPPMSFQEEMYGASQPMQQQPQQRGRPLSASMHAAHRSRSRGSGAAAAASSSSLFRPSAPSARPRSAVPSSSSSISHAASSVRNHRSVVSAAAVPSNAHHRLSSPKHPPAYHPAPSGPPPLPHPPAHSFYRRPGAPSATHSDRLVEGVVSDPAAWRQTNLRTLSGLRGVQQVMQVAKQNMHDKHNPYLR